MTVVGRLQCAGYRMHLTDQVALVSVPLVAALAFDASARTIGVLVACQSLAHLIGSLPFGLIVDRMEAKRLMLASILMSLFGFSGAVTSVWFDSLPGFAVSVTCAGFGIVLFVLVTLSILPKAVPADTLAQANARIEIPRAISSFAVPLAIGVVISDVTVAWVFVVATLGALAALGSVLGLPRFEASPSEGQGLFRRVIQGGAFVIGHDLLMAISLCSLFWNVAFSALLVTMVPLITDVYRMEPGTFGLAMAAFGLAAIIGSWTAARFADHIPPNLILLFGPGSSVLAVFLLFLIPPGGSVLLIYGAFFLLGFGPSMWLIVQNSVRQLVGPSQLLGRVNAVIQTAIYGIRPLGALVGGVIVEATSARGGLLLIVAVYVMSFAAAAFSRLRVIKRYSDLTIQATG